jgi:hypothetical protein
MARRNDFVWYPERDARLRALYAEGRTWATIAATFGISRGAAVGRGHRLGLNTRAKVGKSAQRLPGPVAGHVSRHLEVLANGNAVRRAEGGAHVLPAGDALTWALVLSSTPILGDVPWPWPE